MKTEPEATPHERAKKIIKTWLESRNMTPRQLSEKAGMSPCYVADLLRRDMISLTPYKKLNRFIGFPADLMAELKAAYTRLLLERSNKGGNAKEVRGLKHKPSKPWPKTVAEFKQQKPIYASAW